MHLSKTFKCQICNKPGKKSEMRIFARPVVAEGRPTWFYFGVAHQECHRDFLSDLEDDGAIQSMEKGEGWEILDPAKLPQISFNE